MAKYIEREALRKVLENWRDAHADVDDEHGCGLLEDVIWEADAQPAADVTPVVHGVWVCVNKIDPISGYRCSKCRRRVGFDLTPYCPNCGAKMDGRE